MTKSQLTGSKMVRKKNVLYETKRMLFPLFFAILFLVAISVVLFFFCLLPVKPNSCFQTQTQQPSDIPTTAPINPDTSKTPSNTPAPSVSSRITEWIVLSSLLSLIIFVAVIFYIIRRREQKRSAQEEPGKPKGEAEEALEVPNASYVEALPAEILQGIRSFRKRASETVKKVEDKIEETVQEVKSKKRERETQENLDRVTKQARILESQIENRQFALGRTGAKLRQTGVRLKRELSKPFEYLSEKLAKVEGEMAVALKLASEERIAAEEAEQEALKKFQAAEKLALEETRNLQNEIDELQSKFEKLTKDTFAEGEKQQEVRKKLEKARKQYWQKEVPKEVVDAIEKEWLDALDIYNNVHLMHEETRKAMNAKKEELRSIRWSGSVLSKEYREAGRALKRAEERLEKAKKAEGESKQKANLADFSFLKDLEAAREGFTRKVSETFSALEEAAESVVESRESVEPVEREESRAERKK